MGPALMAGSGRSFFLKEWLEGLPDGFGNDLLTFYVGMNAIALVEGRDAADVLQEERDKGCIVLFSEFGEEVAELCTVDVAHIGWDLHSGKDDLRGWIFFPDGVDDSLKVIAGTVEGDTAKAVVGAEFQDEDVDRLAEYPADAGQPSGTRFAAITGIDARIWEVKGIEAMADEGGKGLVGFEAVAGGEAVSEKQNGFCVVGVGCGMGTIDGFRS